MESKWDPEIGDPALVTDDPAERERAVATLRCYRAAAAVL